MSPDAVRAGAARANPLHALCDALAVRPGTGLPAWQTALRERALTRLRALAVPDTRSEAWRYTSLPTLADAVAWLPRAASARPDSLVGADEPGDWLAGDAAHGMLNLMLLDGVLLGRVPAPVPGDAAHAAALRITHEGQDGAVQETPADDVFQACNAALFEAPLCIDVAAGQRGGTLRLRHRTTVGAAGQVAPRVIVRLGAGADLTLIDDLAPAGGLYNLVTDIELAPGATLRHRRVGHAGDPRDATGAGGATSIAHTHVRVRAGARYDGFMLLEGGARQRETLVLDLLEREAAAALAGVGHVHGRRHADLALCIRHAADDTRSSTDYRGIAGDRGRLVFRGEIHIPEGVRGIDAALTNKNLLLSNDAEIDTRPELTINADDVRCSHGATVGQLDADALFLLRARGIDEAHARALVKRAFAMTALAGLPDDALRGALQARLQQVLEDAS